MTNTAKIYVVGIGPGNMEEITPRAKDALTRCDCIIGYTAYIELIKDWFPQKQFIDTGMTGELERCRIAVERAENGDAVALVSSGDSGIYGIAGLMLELAGREGHAVPVEVIPGITAASAAAAVLGAPLMHDFAAISLSDCLTPWETILKRIRSAASADFIICFYNPKSKNRTEHSAIAREELLKFRKASTPVGIVRNAGRKDETSVVTDLDNMLEYNIDMFSIVIVGNSQTYIKNSKMITPRGYRV